MSPSDLNTITTKRIPRPRSNCKNGGNPPRENSEENLINLMLLNRNNWPINEICNDVIIDINA